MFDYFLFEEQALIGLLKVIGLQNKLIKLTNKTFHMLHIPFPRTNVYFLHS